MVQKASRVTAQGKRRGGRSPVGGYTTAAQRKSALRSTLYASAEWWEYLRNEQLRRRTHRQPYDFSSIVIDGLKLLDRDGLRTRPPAPAEGWSSTKLQARRVGVFLPAKWASFVAQETARNDMDQTSLFVAGLAALRRETGRRGTK